MSDATQVQHGPYGHPDTVPNLPLPHFEEERSRRACGDGRVRIPQAGVTGFVINENADGLLVALWGPALDRESVTIVVRRDGHEVARSALVRWCRRVADGCLVGFAFDREADAAEPMPLTRRSVFPLNQRYQPRHRRRSHRGA